ncbi:ATP-dependent nuclease [Promicromonospora sp. MS192]|uniref:ATP-dependent nuclease n=1 Tax=Promicromonospora sp. MS192 TaxID=3412684 RepID=UPI003C2DE0C5
MIERIVVQGYRLFQDFEMEPTTGLNIVVGGNEAGKSTLLEAIGLALTGRVDGRRVEDVLNPYWFNQQQVADYFSSLSTNTPMDLPEILIELYFSSSDPNAQLLRGVHNSRKADAPGVRLHIRPSDDYAVELAEYLADATRLNILPVEYYEVQWCDFADARLHRRPNGLGVAFIDSRTIRSTYGVDHNTREMLTNFMDAKERAAISVAHRGARQAVTRDALAGVNERIAAEGVALSDRTLGLQMDQSAAAAWETSVVPHVENVPFALAGQGQQAAIKVALALNRSAASTAYVLIEEPENHLSHTALTRLIDRVENLAAGRQVFITTHSSYVLNRLGVDRLRLLHAGKASAFSDISPNTVNYFRKLSGFDTLRLVLADKLVLVEGPSDEMLFERAFIDKHSKKPIDAGIDIVSMQGVSLARALELAAALDHHKVAAIRDNDGQEPEHWRGPVAQYLADSKRDLFIGDPALGSTLEPQVVKANAADEAALREALGITDESTSIEKWMHDHKTGAALRLADAPTSIVYPEYLTRAIEFVA